MNAGTSLIYLDWSVCDAGYDIDYLPPDHKDHVTSRAELIIQRNTIGTLIPIHIVDLLRKSSIGGYGEPLADYNNLGTIEYLIPKGQAHSPITPFEFKRNDTAITQDFLNALTDEKRMRFCNTYGNPFDRAMISYPLDIFKMWQAACFSFIEFHRNEQYDDMIKFFGERPRPVDFKWTSPSMVEIRLRRFPNSPVPQLVIVPVSVMSGIWITLLQQVSGNMTFRKCAWCGNLFTVPPTSNKIYDLPKCRVAAHRAEKEKNS